MTKHRPPHSVEQALGRIAGHLEDGVETMARLTRRSVSLVRKWGDPERREQISIDDAIALDIAYLEAGGIGAPIYEAYTVRLELAEVNRFADRAQLGQLTPEILRECGEAGAALVAALLPGACERTRKLTRREVEEAISALTRALPLLEDAPEPQHQTGPPG